MVSDLRMQLEQSKHENEELEKKYGREALTQKFQMIRATSNAIAQKYQVEKDDFLKYIVSKIKALINCTETLHSEDPIREFNYVYRKLSEAISSRDGFGALLSSAVQQSTSEQKTAKRERPAEDPIVSGDYREFLLSCCGKLGDESERLGELPDCGIQDRLTKLIEQKDAECERYKQAMNAIARSLQRNPSENVDEVRDQILQAIDAQDGVNLIDIDKIMEKLTPVELPIDETATGRLEMLDRTLAVLSPFDTMIGKLSKLLDKHYQAYLPTSKYFSGFLDALTHMKDHIRRIGPNSIFREVYSVMMKSAELFRALGISLSSASFAPEYSGNQQVVAAILDAQLSASAQITSLRILLQEKEQLLEAETGKVAQCESEFADYKKAHPG
jgi:hypothetical protein